MKIGILTVRDKAYHPNARLMDAGKARGHALRLMNPYTITPGILKGKLFLGGMKGGFVPDLLFPRQGAQVRSASLTLIRHLSLMGIPMVNGLESILLARNQFLTLQVLASAGVDTVDTCFINASENLKDAVDRLGGFPVVVKKISSRQGRGVFLLSSEMEARTVIPRILDSSKGLLVQRFVHPEGRHDYRVLVIKDRVSAAMTLKPVAGDFRSNIHLKGQARRVILTESIEQKALSASKALGLDIAGVDLVVDARGRVMVLEVNYSPGFRGLESVTGLDIAGMIIDHGVSTV